LNDECRRIALRNMALSAELVRLLGILTGGGIEVIPYKGPVLANLVYGDVALRRFTDVDILVRDRDVVRTRDMLVASNYVGGKNSHLGFIFAENSCHVALLQPELNLSLEVHWALAPSYFPMALKGERLWQCLRKAPFAGIEVNAHCPEDLLLILAIHGGKHHWDRLIWIVDVAELIRQSPQLRWDWMLAEAARYGCRRMLQVGLWLAYEVLQAPVPDRVRNDWAADAAIVALGEEVLGLMGEPAAPSWDNPRFDLRLRERVRDRLALRMGWALEPTDADWQLANFSRPWRVLYYPLRVVRLVAKYGTKLIEDGFSAVARSIRGS
jgi:Uncharacterised nucleotidyltransferase